MAVDLALLVICALASGFASGSETALVSASRTRLKHLGEQGLRSARRALALLEDKERVLIVTLIVTNVFNIAAGAVATSMLAKAFGPWGPFLATVTMTAVLLIFSEIVPKAYFRHHAERMLVRAALVWKILAYILVPVTIPVQLFSGFIARLFRCEPRSIYRTRDEIKLVLEESMERGGLRQDQQEMLESTLNYSMTIVREVMVPISDVALIAETARTEALLEIVRRQGHTRIPVFRERVDQIVGLVNIFDILFDKQKKIFIRPYVRPVRLVPETKQIDQLFVEMQRDRQSLAVVVNEFGACFGIVTLEDMMEEIFGELADEHEDTTPDIEQKAAGHFRVNGTTDVDDLKSETGIDVVKEGFETVGGWVLHRLGRIPRAGEGFQDEQCTVRVVDADRYSVKAVDIIRKDAVDTDQKPMS
ncbi:MAG: HlyC/CorC family transporter [Deltaproteobacteria bacterium]|nr:HlyC/CorC family transporter [Deltaproteobacteria bacterium]